MEAGIVGLPNVGKSTLFNALTSSGAAQSANYPFCTIEPNEGIVSVPDPRLRIIESFIQTKKVVPAILRLVDIAGIVKGASEGEGLGNRFLSHIREVDAVLHVVRCFTDDDVTHVGGAVDPLTDIGVIETELLLADLQTLENALPKAERAARGGDREARLRVDVIRQCSAHADTEQPLRTLDLPEDAAVVARGLGLITAKPVLYIANVDEDDVSGSGPIVQQICRYAEDSGAEVVPVCARFEAELAELDESDRGEMLAAAGLDEPALATVARAAYRTLGLQSFSTLTAVALVS